MVADIFSDLNNDQYSMAYKGGSTLLNIAQYLYKSRQHSAQSKTKEEKNLPVQPSVPSATNQVKETIDNTGLKKSITNAIQAKFIVQNADRVIEFKNLLEQECRDFATATPDFDFEPLFDEQQKEFDEEFKK